MDWLDFMAPEAELFGAPRLPGLRYAENFLSWEEERVLIEKIDGSALTPFRFQQWIGKRLTRSYGWNYDFETGKFAPTEALPEWLMPIRARAAHFVGIPPEDLAQARPSNVASCCGAACLAAFLRGESEINLNGY